MPDYEKFRRLLEKEKDRLEHSVDHLTEMDLDESLSESIQEFSTYDNHPADIAWETWDREKDFGLREDAMTTLDMVEEAFRRLGQGTYGWCERCGRPIPEARLEAVPWTAYCVRCESDLEREESGDWVRPMEELADPAFSSFRDHDPRGTVEFDGEDSWQTVARWGTSNTPADTPPARGYDDAYVGAGEDVGTVADIEKTPDATFDPGQVGEEGTLSYENGRVISSRTARAEAPGESPLEAPRGRNRPRPKRSRRR